jgi:hypothetical protein
LFGAALHISWALPEAIERTQQGPTQKDYVAWLLQTMQLPIFILKLQKLDRSHSVVSDEEDSTYCAAGHFEDEVVEIAYDACLCGACKHCLNALGFFKQM